MKSHSSLCSPASILRRVNREWLINLAGGRALLLELAHPLVAAGVAQHSRFEQHPFRRLWRTFTVMRQIVFGNEEERGRALRAFHECHRHVHGRLHESEGQYAAGDFYHANDPALKLWVLATLIDSALLGYETFVAPLAAQDKQAYYEESKHVALRLGIPSHSMPATNRDFEGYMADMLTSKVLRVGAPARQIVAALLKPSMIWPMTQAARFFGVGLLPERFRREYRMSWSQAEEKRLRLIATHLKRLRRGASNLGLTLKLSNYFPSLNR